MSLAYLDGRLLSAAEARIDPGDAGFLFGDGLFETLRVDGGRARDLEAHLDRLFAGLQRIEIDLPEDREALASAAEAVASESPRPAARLRVTVSRGAGFAPTRWITASPYEPPSAEQYRAGVAVQVLPNFPLDSRSPLAGLKSLSYQAQRLALRRAEAQGCWEALLLNERGRLAEGTRSNLALVLPGGVFTPPESDGCLPGTVRRRLLERNAIEIRSLAPSDLAEAAEVLLLNSLVGVLPAGRVDGRTITAGETAERLRALLP